MMIILDTSVWVALLHEKDSQYEKALESVSSLDWEKVVLPDLVFYEVLTVIKIKSELKLCLPKVFLKLLKTTEVDYSSIPNEIIELSIKKIIATSQKTSFVDICLYEWSRQDDVRIITFDASLEKWIKT